MARCPVQSFPRHYRGTLRPDLLHWVLLSLCIRTLYESETLSWAHRCYMELGTCPRNAIFCGDRAARSSDKVCLDEVYCVFSAATGKGLRNIWLEEGLSRIQHILYTFWRPFATRYSHCEWMQGLYQRNNMFFKLCPTMHVNAIRYGSCHLITSDTHVYPQTATAKLKGCLLIRFAWWSESWIFFISMLERCCRFCSSPEASRRTPIRSV